MSVHWETWVWGTETFLDGDEVEPVAVVSRDPSPTTSAKPWRLEFHDRPTQRFASRAEAEDALRLAYGEPDEVVGSITVSYDGEHRSDVEVYNEALDVVAHHSCDTLREARAFVERRVGS